MSSREENRPERARSKARSSDVGWELMGAKLLIRHHKQRTAWRDSSEKPRLFGVRRVELLLQVRKPAGVVGSDGLAVLPSAQVFGEPVVPPGFVLISLSRGSVLGGHLAAPFASGSNPGSVDSVKRMLIPARSFCRRWNRTNVARTKASSPTIGRTGSFNGHLADGSRSRTGMATSANEGFDIRRRERRQVLSGN